MTWLLIGYLWILSSLMTFGWMGSSDRFRRNRTLSHQIVACLTFPLWAWLGIPLAILAVNNGRFRKWWGIDD